jgi:hypothetical protein
MILLEKNGNALSIWSMSIFGTSLLPITSTRVTCVGLAGVWLETWLETSWPNPYRVLCFGNSEIKSWDPGPGKVKMKIDKSNTHTAKPTKG